MEKNLYRLEQEPNTRFAPFRLASPSEAFSYDLDELPYKDEWYQVFFSAWRSHFASTLLHLDLTLWEYGSDVSLGIGYIGEHFGRDLLPLLRDSCLECLNLSLISATDEEMKAFFELAPFTLKHLRWDGLFEDANLKLAAQGVLKTSLESLEIGEDAQIAEENDCYTTDVGVLYLAAILGRSKLNRLVIRKHSAGSSGLAGLLLGLVSMSEFTAQRGLTSTGKVMLMKRRFELIYSDCDLSSGDFGMVCDAISSCQVLTLLDLSLCQLQDDNIVALCGAIAKNTSLEVLVLDGNPFSERSLRALESLAFEHSSLVLISVSSSDNPESEAAQERLGRILIGKTRE
jgi:hypothetical protein